MGGGVGVVERERESVRDEQVEDTPFARCSGEVAHTVLKVLSALLGVRVWELMIIFN